MNKLENKKMIVFDLDGTLTPSKQEIEPDMAELLCRLLAKWRVAVIGGGKPEIFFEQFLYKLSCKGALNNLFVLPANGAAMFEVINGDPKEIYRYRLSEDKRKKIIQAVGEAASSVGYAFPEEPYGEVVEDRGAQVTFSALGQDAPLSKKESWNRENDNLRRSLAMKLQELLPSFAVEVGGLTSIDVNQKGIDKAYGIEQLENRTGIARGDMLFIGDAIFPGGNDWSAAQSGVEYIKVKDPEETKEVIKRLPGVE